MPSSSPIDGQDEEMTLSSPPLDTLSSPFRKNMKRLRREARVSVEPPVIASPDTDSDPRSEGTRDAVDPVGTPVARASSGESEENEAGGGGEGDDNDGFDPLFGEGGQFTGVDAGCVDLGMEVDGVIKEVDEEGDRVLALEKEDKKEVVGDESDSDGLDPLFREGDRFRGAGTVDLDLRMEVDDVIKENEGEGDKVVALEKEGTGKDGEEEVVGDDDGLDPLFGEGGRFTGVDTANLDLGMEVDGVLKNLNEEGNGGKGLEKEGKNKKKKKKLEKRVEREDDNEGNVGRKKKKKKKDVDGGDGKPVESARNKRKLEKERTAYVQQLHAESQRILRETKDVSFKPLPHVQKPISLVLEKIRLRKIEMLKKIRISEDTYSSFDANASDGCHPETSEKAELDKSLPCPETIATSEISEILLDSNEKIQADDSLDSNPGHECLSPDVVLQDSMCDSPGRDEITQLKNQIDSSPEVPVLASHETPTKPDSDQTDYTSSDGEDSFKENIDPLKKDKRVDLYKEAVLKIFVDDEAEEEDDSDHDLMRFQDNDDEYESEGSEGLNDMIATGFEEMPVDQKRRNELHQMWLEKLDADETDNVLQRINNCVRQREPAILQDVDEGINENSGEDSDEDTPDAPVSENEPPAISKTAKDMIATMFDDKDDGFVSSDNEESERRLSRQRLLEKAGFRSSVLSPQVDDNSKEIFSLIKKLNIAPDPKKRPKTATRSYEGLLKVENTNSSSKSSFLGRLNSNSLPSLKKKGSNTFKSFVFGRDDSNSRSAISASENLSDMGGKKQNQNQWPPAKTSSSLSASKKNISKVKSVSPKMKSPKSESSLFEILQRSSLQFDQQKLNQADSPTVLSENKTARHLTTFKL